MLKHQTLTSSNRRAHTEHTGALTPSKELDIILNQSAESNLTSNYKQSEQGSTSDIDGKYPFLQTIYEMLLKATR